MKTTKLICVVILMAITTGPATMLYAQDNEPDRREHRDNDDDDDHCCWGLAGLIGLAGLAGLYRKDKDHKRTTH